ncbi:hypothetical protein [Paenibacillus glycinis]|uniref:Uncharacterized protein n=1 Tax=Paenibacillus glycinis TaxID=2697035 RepID=A0ABW9XN81_9BACL|nr:hypothetical protein [Paenibacillus glycinis]NBD23847.1 hypothetical protein [Paenibacillus glycinis]
MKMRYAAYGIAALLIIASWIGNIAYSRYYRLPEGRFLVHRIEATDTPSAAFALVYVANKDDKRTIRSIAVGGLPTLRFGPANGRQELSRQTVYTFMGSYAGDPARKSALPPLVVRDVDVTFDDGQTQTMRVGEIIVYRDDYPPREIDSPVTVTATTGGSDHSGSVTALVNREAELTGTTSAWLSRLGQAFPFRVSLIDAIGQPATSVKPESDYPVRLVRGQHIVTDYQFRFPAGDPHAMEAYNLLLTHEFLEADGERTEYRVDARYVPDFTESRMKAFVRAARREAG